MRRATAASLQSASSRSWPSGRLTNDTGGSGSSRESSPSRDRPSAVIATIGQSTALNGDGVVR